MDKFLSIMLPKNTIFLELLFSTGLKIISTLDQKKLGMSKQDEIKKLKERIEELEFVKDVQQDVIADMEIITGVDMSKKSLPKTLAEEIQKKKQNRLKENG